jgi:hypothetical protein
MSFALLRAPWRERRRTEAIAMLAGMGIAE